MVDIVDRQAVFAGVLLLANRMQTHYDAELGQVTLKQWLALTVLNSMPPPVPSTAVLARALGTTHQNVTKLVRALADQGFVELQASPTDGRAKQVLLTPATVAYMNEHAHQGERLLDELFAGASAADVAACLRVLGAMSVALTGDGILPPNEES